jgi:hypothetical protein
MDPAKTYDIVQKVTRGRMLDTLEKKLRPDHTALVVIDVQNDFCAGQGMMAAEGFDMTFVQSMATRLPEMLDRARAANVFVVFVRNIYNASPNLYLSDVWLEQAARKREGSYVTRRFASRTRGALIFSRMCVRWRRKPPSPNIATALSTIQISKRFSAQTEFGRSCWAVARRMSVLKLPRAKLFCAIIT